MGRFAKWGRIVGLGAALFGLVAVPVVATESWKEYDTWHNRPLGVLDIVYGVLHSDLPPMPDWECDLTHASRLTDDALTVHAIGVEGASAPTTDLTLSTQLGARLGVPVDLIQDGSAATLDEVRAKAAASPRNVYIVYHDGYFEGSELHEKIEGLACNNVAIVNINTSCTEGVAAHELGHVLGLQHTPDGLMRARAAACDATLDASQTGWLIEHSEHTPTQSGLLLG